MIRLLYILILSSLNLSVFAQNIDGNWRFKNISNVNDTLPLRTIVESDYMKINDDSTFQYELSAIDLRASGDWRVENNILQLKYNLPTDTIREYQIRFDENQLVLTENNIEYSFVKSVDKKSTNSGFDFKSILRGLLGIIILIGIAFILSRNRQKIDWNIVWKGLFIQIIFAVAILKVPFVQKIFDSLSAVFVTVLAFTREGSLFLFGGLIDNIDSFGYIFAFQVLPTIIFFSALTSVLFYYGILQKIVYFFAVLMKKTLKLSGAESLSAIGNIFLGQTESPLLIKPYIKSMTLSELLCLMSGGMATIAGGVLAAYIGFLGGSDPIQQLYFAKHLLAASVMSAPAAVVAAKILLPETEDVNQDMTITDEQLGSNVLEAISIGTTQGVKLAVNVGAMLLVFIAFIAMINYFLNQFVGDLTGINQWVERFTDGQYTNLSLEFLLGYIFAPISWVLGVCKEDIILVGQLLGEKTILNEFVAYVSLGELKSSGQFFEEKSIIIATYVLCGFANFASIGIQIGGIGVLAPSRIKDLSKLGILALIAGTFACLFTAVIVGMIL
ncbi:MAG: nucleoside transporter C-terminal domain-containing protein [Flavobacteriales bacterium]